MMVLLSLMIGQCCDCGPWLDGPYDAPVIEYPYYEEPPYYEDPPYYEELPHYEEDSPWKPKMNQPASNGFIARGAGAIKAFWTALFWGTSGESEAPFWGTSGESEAPKRRVVVRTEPGTSNWFAQNLPSINVFGAPSEPPPSSSHAPTEKPSWVRSWFSPGPEEK